MNRLQEKVKHYMDSYKQTATTIYMHRLQNNVHHHEYEIQELAPCRGLATPMLIFELALCVAFSEKLPNMREIDASPRTKG